MSTEDKAQAFDVVRTFDTSDHTFSQGTLFAVVRRRRTKAGVVADIRTADGRKAEVNLTELLDTRHIKARPIQGGEAIQLAQGLTVSEWEALCIVLAQYGRGVVHRGPGSGKELKAAAGRLRTMGLLVADGTKKWRRKQEGPRGYSPGFHTAMIYRVTDLGRAVAIAWIGGLVNE